MQCQFDSVVQIISCVI